MQNKQVLNLLTWYSEYLKLRIQTAEIYCVFHRLKGPLIFVAALVLVSRVIKVKTVIKGRVNLGRNYKKRGEIGND